MGLGAEVMGLGAEVMGLGAEVMEPGTAETRKQEGRRERGPRVGRAFWPRREPVTPEAIEACNRASTAMPFRRELAISRNALTRARQRLNVCACEREVCAFVWGAFVSCCFAWGGVLELVVCRVRFARVSCARLRFEWLAFVSAPECFHNASC